MSVPKEYTKILNDLNKEVIQKQPTDILQFCANFFLARLQDQRKQLWNIEPQVKSSLGISLFSNKSSTQSVSLSCSSSDDSSPLIFKQPFTNDDPHAKNYDESDPHTVAHSASHQTGSSIFKTNFEIGEDSHSSINITEDPISQKLKGIDFATANSIAAEQARRSSQSIQVQPLPHNIPSSFNANRRTSVSAETLNPSGIKDDWTPPVIPKTQEQLNRLSNSVVKNFLFSSLDEDSLKTVINALKEVKLSKGSEVIKQGDEGDFFYVVESGQVDFLVNGAKVNNSGPGSSFGELALMYNSPRAATAIANTDLVLWALDRLTFRRILLERTSKKRQLYESFLKEVPVLSNLSLFERSKIADALDTEIYKSGDVIIKEGEVGENFYLMIKGSADVIKSKEGVVSSLKRGDYFGEVALLNDLPRQASVVAKEDVAVATLDKRGFQRLLGPAVEVLKRQDPTKHQ